MQRFVAAILSASCLASASLLAQAPVAVRGQELPTEAPPAMRTITRQDLLRHATWFASDERGGRLTGSPGQVETAKYIAEHFASLGLEPLGDEQDGGGRGFHQYYGIRRTTVADSTKIAVGSLQLADGFAVLGGKAMDADAKGKARFVGLGRTRGDSADVGADEDLTGQLAIALVRPPSGRVDAPLSVEQKFGLSFRAFGLLGQTAKALEKKGAAAVLFVMLDDPTGFADVLNYLAVSPGKDTLAARFSGADRQMEMVASMGGAPSNTPTVIFSIERSQAILAELGVDVAAAKAYVAGEAALPNAKPDLPAAARVEVTVDDDATASNVVAVLRGSDPELAKEAIVYSAHMDHVGRRLDGEVFNGADDNASGSAGLLGIASAFAAGKERPKRSVIFLSVSGEELGLWGSAWYADNPTWAADKLVANINTDMIGRSGPESDSSQVTVTPSHRHAMFSTLVRDAATFGEQLGLSFTSGDKYYMRSDHYNFAKKGIPVVFFCNGEHEDYHQVTDHADKLDGDKMERIARLAFWTGWAAANAESAPTKLGRQADWR